MKINKHLVAVLFSIITGAASIISVLLILVINNNNRILTIVLGIFCVFFLAIVGLLFWGIRKFIHKEYLNTYEIPSIFISYEKRDEANICYEAYKVIQSKRLKTFKYTQKFKWSLPTDPTLSSDLQTIGDKRKGGANKYDEVDMVFHKPLRFNEITTVHFKAEMQDPDYNSSPHVELLVEQSIRYVDFRICLLSMPDDYTLNAIITKRPISASNDLSQSTIIAEVPFIKETKTYQYFLTEPETLFYYRIEWKWLVK